VVTRACLALSAALAFGVESRAQGARRAVIIGINDYAALAPSGAPTRTASSAARNWRSPTGRGLITDLYGSANDAESMFEVATRRLGFEASNVRLLLNAAATRRAILDSIRVAGDRSAAGDVLLVFFAGHGALRRNSASPKGLDQTIVPADANRGVDDIRDKELAALVAPIAQRGVVVTLIFDSCNSGSITRGDTGRLAYRQRWAVIDERDVNTPYRGPIPAEVGVLTLSASEDVRPAVERVGSDGLPHGLFTEALLEAVRASSPNATSRQIFAATRAMVQGLHAAQEPSIDASTARLDQPLFGGGASSATLVAVLHADDPARIELQGGLALGIRPGATLRAVDSLGANTPRLRVTASRGVARSIAELTSGAFGRVRSGSLFAIDGFAAGNAEPFRVHVPESPPTLAEWRGAVAVLDTLRRQGHVRWDDPAADRRGKLIFGAGSWQLEFTTDTLFLGRRLETREVRDSLRRRGITDAIGVELPPPLELITQLAIGTGTPNDFVERVDLVSAMYALSGSVDSTGQPRFAWSRVGGAEPSGGRFMPARTRDHPWGAAPREVAALLRDDVLALARVRTWLTLSSPPDDGRFPYRLAFHDSATGKLRVDGELRKGEVISLALIADSQALRGNELQERFVYVFTIDAKTGAITLHFPFDRTNSGNRLPYRENAARPLPTVIYLGGVDARGQPLRTFDVEPSGLETYIMLATDEAIPPDALEGRAVRSATTSALARLLYAPASRTRDLRARVTPTTWTLQRLQIDHVAR
jgi:hypothetical protein